MTSTAIARTPGRSPEIQTSPATPVPSPLASPLGQMIEPFREQLTPFLRDGQTLERVAAELVLASRKTPNLDRCPAPALVDAVCRALETGGTIGQDVFIVPFKDKGVYEPTVMVGYQFKASLVQMAGGARSIDARVVYDDEAFSVRYGDSPSISHQPALKGKPGRKIIGAYAVAFHGPNHTPTVLWLTLDEIEAVRMKSKQWSPSAGVKDLPPWYGCKTAVHRLVKLLPKNPKLARVLGLIEREELQEYGDPDQIVGGDTPAHAPAFLPAGTDYDLDGVDVEEEEPTPEPVKAMTLAEASGIQVQGRVLGGYRNTALDRIEATAREKVNEAGEDSPYARLLVAIGVLRAARLAGQAFEPAPKKDAEA